MEKSNIEKWDEDVAKNGCVTQDQIRCITFDKEAQENLPQYIKDKMKADREKARKEKPWEGVVKPNIVMKPSIGRIVIFQVNEDQREKLNNYQPTAPAIVTAVWSDECVNLKVILDGETNLWVTSAMKGTGENQWEWPVIV